MSLFMRAPGAKGLKRGVAGSTAVALALLGLVGLQATAAHADPPAGGYVAAPVAFTDLAPYERDRTTPSGGYDVTESALSLTIESDLASTTGAFYQTEGVGALIDGVDGLSASLYVDPAWESVTSVRAGLWLVVAPDAEGDDAWPIIEFTNIGGAPRIRTYDTFVTGEWTDVTAVEYGRSYRLGAARNGAGGIDYLVDGSVVGSLSNDDYRDNQPYRVIFNDYNLGAADGGSDYSVTWSELQALQIPVAPPVSVVTSDLGTWFHDEDNQNGGASITESGLNVWINGSGPGKTALYRLLDEAFPLADGADGSIDFASASNPSIVPALQYRIDTDGDPATWEGYLTNEPSYFPGHPEYWRQSRAWVAGGFAPNTGHTLEEYVASSPGAVVTAVGFTIGTISSANDSTISRITANHTEYTFALPDPTVVTVYPAQLSATNASAGRTTWRGAFPAAYASTLPSGTGFALDIEDKILGSYSVDEDGLELSVVDGPLAAPSPAVDASKTRFQYYLGSGGFPTIDALDTVTVSDVFQYELSWTQTHRSGISAYGPTLQIQVQKQVSPGNWQREWLTSVWPEGSGEFDLGAGKWFASTAIGGNNANSGPGVDVAALLGAYGDWQVVSFGPNLGRDNTYAWAVQDLSILGTEFHFAPGLTPATGTSTEIVFSPEYGYNPLAAGAPAGQNGWVGTGGRLDDWGIVPAANALRLSNGLNTPGISWRLESPEIEPAGAPGSGAGYNTFSSSFTLASETGGWQPGLNAQVAIDKNGSRFGGYLNLRHTDAGQLELALLYPYDGLDLEQWRSPSVPLDPAQSYEIGFSVQFRDDAPDIVTLTVDGEVALVGGSWKLELGTWTDDPTVNGLLFKAGNSGAGESGVGYDTVAITDEQKAALVGHGFLFSDIAYSVSNTEVQVAPSIGLASIEAGHVGDGYDVDLQVTGSPVPTVALVAGHLPTGLSLLGDRLVGTAEAAGTFSFTIEATNSAGAVERSYSLRIALPDLTAGTPSVSGPLQVGEVLTADAGAWAPAPVELSYRWYTVAADLATRTLVQEGPSASYTLTAADAGKYVYIVVDGSKAGYVPASTQSAWRGFVGLAALTPGTPVVTGPLKVGEQLTADAGDWSPVPVELSYRWYTVAPDLVTRTLVQEGLSASYTPVAADAGKYVYVAVVGSKAGYTTGAVQSAWRGLVAPATLTVGTSTISGALKVGSLLTADPGTWGPAQVDLEYRWYTVGADLGSTALVQEGASDSYSPTAADVGKYVYVVVIGSKAGYTTVATQSAWRGFVSEGTITAGTPIVTGTLKVGSVLTANAGSWGPAPVALSYRWYTVSPDLATRTLVQDGASATYTPAAVDAGKYVYMVVIATKDGYTSTAAQSAWRGYVLP
ncbi:MAG: hypothetical protein J7484_09735 [Microbacterium sp.]|nr:hypothetical protein [Microbacterium sp.]